MLNESAYTVANLRDSAACSPAYAISGDVRDSSGAGIKDVAVSFGGVRPAVTTNSSGYYSQSGFGDGDYTVSFNLSGYVFSPVEDQVTVSGDDATHDATGYPFDPATLPFSDGFESGVLGSAWAVETDYEGRVRVDDAYPHGGAYSLLLDDEIGNTVTSHAAAILVLDLGRMQKVELLFWYRNFSDEDDADDGLFISDDYGATWYRVFSFSGGPEFDYDQVSIDLAQAAKAAGMSLNDHFMLKFQFYDTHPIVQDGYGIDDVQVEDTSYRVYLPLTQRDGS